MGLLKNCSPLAALGGRERHGRSDAGAAGQGVQTVEALLVAVLKREGYHVFASKEYMSRVRGGSNSTEIRITDRPRSAFVHRMDILFALDGGVIPHLRHRIGKETIVLGEKKHVEGAPGHPVDVPFVRMAGELGNPIYASTIAVGIALGILGADNAVLKAFLKERFAKKGDEVVEKNVEAAEKGYGFGKHLAYDESIEVKIARNASPDDLLIDGHSAVALGAVAGGCNYISSYPMTPGTGVLNVLAEHGKKLGIVVDQAEDEIAAINHSIGAWYAGARAIVTTSGGGFDLMTEAVSLSGITETPIVTHLASRPGPSTGLPTRTEQGDLNLTLYAGHGEFPRAIFAPGVSNMRTSSPPAEWPMKCSSRARRPPLAITCRRSASARRGIEAVGCVSHRTIRASTRRRRSARDSACSTSSK